MSLNSNLIFEILNIDENNFQIGIFESFDDKQDLLNLYESLIVSTDKEFDRALAFNFESFENAKTSQYYIASNSNLISTKLNKTDDTFVEELQQAIQQVTSQFDEKEHLSFATNRSYKTSVKEIVKEPSQLSILLGFAPPSPTKIVKTISSKPGRGQKSCKFCNAIIGVRCLMCKFCNSLLT